MKTISIYGANNETSIVQKEPFSKTKHLYFCRFESVKLHTSSGMAKIIGIVICMGGAATMAFFKGPELLLLVHHHLLPSHAQLSEAQGSGSSSTWIKGVFLMLLSISCWGVWIVLQVCLIPYFVVLSLTKSVFLMCARL